MLKRIQGKASFATLQDATGRIQIYLNDEGVGSEQHGAFKHWDLGDILFAKGVLFKTMKGELSIRCQFVEIRSRKIFQPLKTDIGIAHVISNDQEEVRFPAAVSAASNAFVAGFCDHPAGV